MQTDPEENRAERRSIPASGICDRCNGKGVVIGTIRKECSICEGTGTVFGRPCPKCKGTTPVFLIEAEQLCRRCFGTGLSASGHLSEGDMDLLVALSES